MSERIISLDISAVTKADNRTQIFLEQFLEKANQANHLLESGKGPGNEYLGWVNLPQNTSPQELTNIKAIAQRLRQISDYLIVIGIGGSYLGAKATLSAIENAFDQQKVIFAGTNLNPKDAFELHNFLQDKEFAICVISKSGSTLETSISFELLYDLAKVKYGSKLNQRIVAITNPNKGQLLQLAKDHGFDLLYIPDDIPGRYSVLTPVGLLPMAYAGINIDRLLEGASLMQDLIAANASGNMAEQYAAVRNVLYQALGYKIEILTTYSSELEYLLRWWQQLFGESEGKQNKGLFPAVAQFTTDLHSLGQYIQQGPRYLFETVIFNHSTPNAVEIQPQLFERLKRLQYADLQDINHKAFIGTLQAHVQGGVPNIVINLPNIDEFTLGQLYYFFQRSCGISGYMLQVNPFDQPGVEFYKRNIYELLGLD